MTSASKSYLKYGIPKSYLHSLLLNSYTLGDYEDCLDRYFLLFWTGEYFRSQLRDGVIKRDGIDYLVSYKDAPSKLKKAQQISLSFRKAKDEFNLPAYVIVRVEKD